MKVFTRKRIVAAALVAAFIAAFAAIGALSRSTTTSAAPAVDTSTTAGEAGVPFVPWYWTMVVSPNDPNVLVLATSKGLYRSSDGGKTWQATGPNRVNATSLIQSGDSLIVGGVAAAPGASPIVKKDGGRAAPDGKVVIAASSDDGKTWTTLHPRGLPDVSVQSLAVDPADSSALYALTTTGKLYHSTDGGTSFQLTSPKLGIPPWAIAVTGKQLVGGDMDRGPFVSADGKAWKKTVFKDSKGGRMVMEYAVQPSNTHRVLMTSYGVELSTDGGTTWQRALKSDVMFGPVAWSPSSSDVAFAIGFDRSLWRSDDAGKTWKKVA